MTIIKQIGGSHYEYGSVDNQHWDLMDRWDIEYLPATASKYVIRYDRKGTPRLDLEKSISYLEKQVACHPNKGCHRLIPTSVMGVWYQSNDVSTHKKIIFELIHCGGSVLELRSAVRIMRETIASQFPEYNERELEIQNAKHPR